MNAAENREVAISVRIADHLITARVPQPPERARVDQLLPIVQALVDAEVDFGLQQSHSSGKPISCCRGCSACCRAQPVPVTPTEAYALLVIVESMPEPQQSALRRRFAENRQALAEAGLIEEYSRPRSELTRDGARAIAERYFALKLPCPFLIDDACSIYARRPFVCRQYCVTSPAALCDDPFHNPVAVVPMSLRPATATLNLLSEVLAAPQFTIPLTMALEYAEAHRAELEQTFNSEDLARRWIDKLVTSPFALPRQQLTRHGQRKE